MSINTAIKTLDTGEEEGEADRGRMDPHVNDDNGGEEEGGNRNDVRRQMSSASIVSGVNDSRSHSHTNCSNRLS